MRWFCVVLLAWGVVMTGFDRRAEAESVAPYDVIAHSDSRLVAQLPNGLVVIAENVPTAPVVSVHCWIKTGAIFEQQHNGAGLSHFLEHLASGGTTSTRTEDESGAILGRIGAQTNAATSSDTVRYFVNTSSDHTDEAIELVSDWMQNSTLPEDEYARERSVIQREFEMGRGDPGRIFWKLTQRVRYRAHPLRHPTIGYIDEFMTITRDELYAFYKQMYVPNNMVFVVAGDIDPPTVVAMVNELWKDAERGELPEMALPVEPKPTKDLKVVGHADIQLARMRLAWPGVRLGGEHDFSLDLLARVLGQGDLSRLVKTVRDDKRLVSSVSAYNYSMVWADGFFGVDAVAAPGHDDQMIHLQLIKEAVLEEVHRIRDEGVTADELARAKSQTVAEVVRSAQTAEATASRLASDFLSTGDPDYLQRYAKAIERLTAEDVSAAAKAILADEHMMEVIMLPSKEPVVMERPAEPTETYATEPVDLDNARLVAKLRELAEEGGAVAEPEIGPMRMVRLPNGLRVITQRNTRLPIVAMQWYHLGGQLTDTPGRAGIASATATMMIKGAGDRTADDISLLLEKTGASMASGSGKNSFYVTAECLSQDWPVILELMSDVIQEPSFPVDEWAKLKTRVLAAIASSDDRWSGEMFNRFHEAWYGEHPWSWLALGKEQTVSDLSAEQLKRFHATHMSASSGVLAIIGDIDPDRVIAEVEKQFGGTPDRQADAFVAVQPKAVEPGEIYRETGKRMAVVMIGYGPTVPVTDESMATMEVMTKVVSMFPSGWISQALRGEGPGLVYAAWGFHRTGLVPGYWSVAFNTDPARAGFAVERSLAVVERLKREPVDEATLRRAINAAVVAQAMGNQSNSQRAAGVAIDELYGRGYDHGERYLEQLRAVTAEAVLAAARKHLNDPLTMVMSYEPIDLEATTPPTR